MEDNNNSGNRGNSGQMEEFNKQIHSWFEDMQKQGRQLSVDQINNNKAQISQKETSKPRANFNGFSAQQMRQMLYFPLEEGCPVQLRHLTEEEISKIPIMRQSLHLINALDKKELKLTTAGYIPPKMVAELYEIGTHSHHTDYYLQRSELKTEGVRVVRILLESTEIIKIQNGKMSLTLKGKERLNNHNALMRDIIMFLFKDYNTGWYDNIEDKEIGNVGRLYSLWLLHRYGKKWRPAQFYEDKYYKAFPTLKDKVHWIVWDIYLDRVFNRLFSQIGVCEVIDEYNRQEQTRRYEIRKTPILDMIFSFVEPAKM